MDCREFRTRHVAYIDDTLPNVEMEAMQRHLRGCPGCARHDTAVRRSLLIVHNLPDIQPSADFMARLEARIGDLRRETPVADRAMAWTYGGITALAASLTLMTYLAFYGSRHPGVAEPIRLAPIVASLPEPMPMPVNDPAFVASMSAGIPVWPTLLLMEQAPMHMANVELQQVSLTR